MANVINISEYFNTTGFKKDVGDMEKGIKNLSTQMVGLVKEVKKVDASLKGQTQTQSNTNKAISDTNKNLDTLAKAEAETAKLTEQTSKIVAKARAERSEENKTLERAKIARTEQNKKIKESIKLEKAESGSINALTAKNKLLVQQRNKVNGATAKGQQAIQKINAEINKNNAAITKSSSGLEKQKGNIGNYASAWSGVPGPIGRVTNSLKLLAANPIILIVTLLVGAITGLIKSMKRSEEGANKLNKLMAGLKAGMAVVLDVVTLLANKLFDAFNDPKQAVIDLWEAIKKNLVNRFEGLIQIFVSLGDIGSNTFKLIKAAVTGNKEAVAEFKKEIGDAAKVAGRAFIQMQTGLDTEQQDAFINGLKNIITEIETESAAAAALEGRRQALLISEREFIVERERLNAQIARARELAQDENIPIAERKKLIEEAIEANDRLFSTEVRFANERAAIVAAEVALGESTREELTKAEELKAEAFRKERARAEGRKSLLRDQKRVINEYNKSIRDDQKMVLDEEILIEKKKLLNFEGTQEEKAKAFEQFGVRILQIQIEQTQILLEDTELTAAERLKIETQLVDQQIALQKELTKVNAEENESRKLSDQERLMAIGDIANGLFDLNASLNERALSDLEEQKEYELSLVGDNAAAKERIEADFARKEAAIKTKQAKADKTNALFQAAINTAIGITSALSMVPAGFALAVIVGILGAIQIAAIAAKPIPKFKHGTPKGGLKSDTIGMYGEAGSELINIPGMLPYIADKPTIGFLPAGTEITPNYELQNVLNNHGGISEKKLDELIKVTKEKKRPVIHSTNITEKGFTHQTEIGMNKFKWKNKYMGR